MTCAQGCVWKRFKLWSLLTLSGEVFGCFGLTNHCPAEMKDLNVPFLTCRHEVYVLFILASPKVGLKQPSSQPLGAVWFIILRDASISLSFRLPAPNTWFIPSFSFICFKKWYLMITGKQQILVCNEMEQLFFLFRGSLVSVAEFETFISQHV